VVCCRQKDLEDALLVSGQFKDALQMLLDWLYKVEPKLSEDQPVHGDIDTVTSLIEEHRVSSYRSPFVKQNLWISFCL
jgi:dystonin